MHVRGMLIATAVVANMLAPSAIIASAADGASSIAVEITGDQLITLKTDPVSLVAIIRELCAKANVNLRGFEAADRMVAANYENVPLRDVLQRLLRDETYMIGVRAGTDTKSLEVSWLHVTASKIAGRSSAPIPMNGNPAATTGYVAPASLSEIGLPAQTVVDALSNEDTAKREEATRVLAEHFDKNPTSLGSFLDKDVATTVDELAAYAYSGDALQTVALRQQDPVSRAKLDGLVKSLRLRSGNTNKKPGFVELMQQGTPH